MTTNLSPVECRPFPTFLKDAMTPSPLQCHNTTNFQHLDVPSGYGQPLGEEWSGWEEFDERSVQPDGDVYRNGGVEQDNDEDIGEGGKSGAGWEGATPKAKRRRPGKKRMGKGKF